MDWERKRYTQKEGEKKKGKVYWRNWRNFENNGKQKGDEDGWADRQVIKKR